MKSLLTNIHTPEALRKLNKSELPAVAEALREFVLDTLSVKPGHLGAGLGVVELTIALHYFYNTPEDLLIWDVGHQSYPHKILTGRKESFATLRQLDGIAGFPCRRESEFDAFGTGHSSTSISAITGMALANQLQQKTNQHIAVIGDASIVSGMAFEGLNHLGSTDLDVLIILNDNSIGIDPSVGALKKHFIELNQGKTDSIFEDFGFHYEGVVDGHDFNALFAAFEKLNAIKGPKLLHIKTTKGKGYLQAEADQVKWHSPGLFNKSTGEISKKKSETISFQQVFGETLTDLMAKNQQLVALTPAMLSGSNLLKAKEQFPDRVWDVGIAEQHAVTLSAGLATQGMIPFCTIYSTFLQRAYDQVIHDVVIQNLPVVFCIDRAGIVGTDGTTHHGNFDIAFLNLLPNVIVSSPMNGQDFQNLLFTAQFTETPFAIRFPKGNTEATSIKFNYEKLTIGKAVELKRGKKIGLLTFGPVGQRISNLWEELTHKENYGHYNFLFCKPLDHAMLDFIFSNYEQIITFEDGVLQGGFGSAVNLYAQEKDYKGEITCRAYPDALISHGTMEELERQMGWDEASILVFIQKLSSETIV